MIEKINRIKRSKHPYSGEINRTSAVLEKIFNILLIVLNSIGFIVAIIASAGLEEWASDHSGDVVDVPVNFFGYFIELESDTFGASPLIVFWHTIIVFAFISLVIYSIKTIITTLLASKANMLDSLYHSEKYIELLVENSCSLKEESSILQKN